MMNSSATITSAPALALSGAARLAMAPDRFSTAHPFPLLVIDDFLPEAFAEGLYEEILALQDLTQSNDYIFAKNKFEHPSLQDIGSYGEELKRFLVCGEFAEALSAMYGTTLFVDPNFTGGGVHRGGSGSFLDMHADFERHPGQDQWVRELNILLYMNRDWRPEYGGSLDLKNGETGKTLSIEPLFNRCVLMLTKGHTLHGYKRTSFPAGTHRNSIAAYAYSLETDAEKLADMSTTTKWKPANASFFKRAIAAAAPALVAAKQRLLGSNTVRNSGDK